MQKFLTEAKGNRILADMKPMAEMLKEWQDLLKLRPAEAARRCKLSSQQWFELTSGATSDPRSSTLQKLSDGTGIPLERIVKAAELQRMVPAGAG